MIQPIAPSVVIDGFSMAWYWDVNVGDAPSWAVYGIPCWSALANENALLQVGPSITKHSFSQHRAGEAAG